jgi:succinyl-CoA synthetase beta subunit
LRGDPRRLVDVLRWIGRGSAVRALFVNIFAGVTDLGEFARLLLQALDALPAFRMPIVARLIGNGFENARQTLAASQIPITVETELERALDALDGVLGKSHRADA